MITKDKILDVAEKLFADKGFDATSLRDITAQANVNLASVNYHFGSKLALLSAVLSRRFQPVNAERLARLDELEAQGRGAPVPVEAVLRAFFAPLVRRLSEPGGGWVNFMQLVGRTQSNTSEDIRACFVNEVQEIANRFIGALAKSLPELPSGVLGYRVHFVIGAMAHTFAFCQGKGMPLVESVPEPEALLENLVDFSAAGLRAPLRTAITKG